MKIAILALDGKYANLALMKISAFHKARGDQVEWYNSLQPCPDKLYVSKLFNFTPDFSYWPNCEVIKGGTGYDIKTRLPDEIETCQPDYSIYPDCDYSLQLFSRGCIRSCPFCIVHEKEGQITPVMPMQLNPMGTHIKVMDNSFFVNPLWKLGIEWLKACKQPVQFENGVDARLITLEQLESLNSLNHHKRIHMAWDNPKDDMIPTFKRITQIIKAWKLAVYVLIGYWSTPEQDMWRVKALDEIGISPFVMPYDKNDHYQKLFARWVNHKAAFHSCRFEDYTG